MRWLLAVLLSAQPAAAAQLPAAFSEAWNLFGQEAAAPASPAPKVNRGRRRRGRVVKHVDLSGQFIDGRRDQGEVGSCHDFTGVALMEAFYFRKHGKHIRFSEADLFMRRTVLSGDIYKGFERCGRARFSEDSNPMDDVKFARANGIATSLDYEKFLERYLRHRAKEEKFLKRLEEERKAMTPEELAKFDPREEWAGVQDDPKWLRQLENRLTGNRADELARERARTKELLKDMKVEELWFDGGDGWAQWEIAVDQLDRGFPVGIGSRDGHAFVITGYRKYKDGSYIFETRDSDYAEKDLDEFWMADVIAAWTVY